MTLDRPSDSQPVEALLNGTKSRATLISLSLESPEDNFTDMKRTFDAKSLVLHNNQTLLSTAASYVAGADPSWKSVRLAHTWIYPYLFKGGNNSRAGIDSVIWKILQQKLDLTVQYFHGGGFNDMFKSVRNYFAKLLNL